MPDKVDKRKAKAQNLELLILSFTLCILIFTITCYAAPCYGTRLPAKKEFFTGVQSYSIFKRYLEDDFGKLRSTQHFILLSYGFSNWFCVDLKGGTGNIKQRPLTDSEVDYASNFSGGYGFRLKLYDKKDFKLTFGFQHISVHPKSTHLGNAKNSAILDDWQYSFLLSREVLKATPYIGTRWSRFDYIHRRNGDRKRRMSDLTKSVGFIVGFDFSVSEKAWLNVEGQFFDSEALAFSLNYNF